MFVGHYGPSFLAKRADTAIPLWVLFVAVQWLDVMWALFVFTGIEKVRIVPGFTKSNALDLYYMPFTHSLPAAIAWGIAGAVAHRFVRGSPRQGLLVGAAVFSHWPLDLLVHKPDLALWDDAAKVGVGLWDYPLLTLGLEAGLLLGSLVAYRAVAGPRGHGYGIPVFCFAILGLQAAMLAGPPPSSDVAMAATALGAYALLAGAIAWLERREQASLTSDAPRS